MSNLDDLLAATSRTFAVAIPLLPQPTRTEITVAYLLCRIADTFEDATAWSPAERLHALEELVGLIGNDDPARTREVSAGWLVRPPVEHVGYLELLAQSPEVLHALHTLSPGVRDIVIRHTQRAARGMARIVAGSTDGRVQLRSIQQLKDYCYVVAGIVGELLTDVFVHNAPQLRANTRSLDATKVIFGETLQLVNILKDESDDDHDGRRYLPPGSRTEVLALARADAAEATRYVRALVEGKAPRGVVAFTAFILLLARTTLDRLESDGPGAKVGRAEVQRVLAHVESCNVDGILLYPA